MAVSFNLGGRLLCWFLVVHFVMNATVSPDREWVLHAPRGSRLTDPSTARGCTSWRSSWREDTTWPSETEEVELHLICLLFSSSSLFYSSVTTCVPFVLGSSDPYVKFKLAGKEVFRSKTIHKNLNPVWDEKTTLILDCLSEPLYVKVKTHSAQSFSTWILHWTEESKEVSVLLLCRCSTMTLAFRMTSWVLLTCTWSLWSSRGASVLLLTPLIGFIYVSLPTAGLSPSSKTKHMTRLYHLSYNRHIFLISVLRLCSKRREKVWV